jgi:uncharacterized protein
MSFPLVTTFLVKIESRCNLACDYCYMYRHADQSWRTQPKIMSLRNIDIFISRLNEYTQAAKLQHISVILHGGEPLLAGYDTIEYFITNIRKKCNHDCDISISLQTNGSLLSKKWIDLFHAWDVTISVSLDGDKSANDRHRITHKMKSSYENVSHGLSIISDHSKGKELLTGILAVIDLENDPIHTYRHLSSYVDSIDFLLPDGMYEDLPPGLSQPGVFESDAPYGKWLARLFDYWYYSDTTTSIRLFENIMDLCLGGASRTEGIGIGYFSILTIETNGSIQDVDVLKIAFEGAPNIHGSFSVETHSFIEVLNSPEALYRAQLVSESGLSNICRRCQLVKQCGGGHLPHRHHSSNGFDNPSIYCGDLAYLIKYIQRCITSDLIKVVNI